MSDSFQSEWEAFYAKAEANHQWIWDRYHDLWFTPAELRKLQSEGRFRWGVVNFELRDPKERADDLQRKVISAVEEEEAFRTKLGLEKQP